MRPCRIRVPSGPSRHPGGGARWFRMAWGVREVRRARRAACPPALLPAYVLGRWHSRGFVAGPKSVSEDGGSGAGGVTHPMSGDASLEVQAVAGGRSAIDRARSSRSAPPTAMPASATGRSPAPSTASAAPATSALGRGRVLRDADGRGVRARFARHPPMSRPRRIPGSGRRCRRRCPCPRSRAPRAPPCIAYGRFKRNRPLRWHPCRVPPQRAVVVDLPGSVVAEPSLLPMGDLF